MGCQDHGRPGNSSAESPCTRPVAPAETPVAPTVSQDVCPQALRLTVSHLAPGGILHVKRRVQESNGFSESNVGDLGIQYETQAVDLYPPADQKLQISFTFRSDGSCNQRVICGCDGGIPNALFAPADPVLPRSAAQRKNR